MTVHARTSNRARLATRHRTIGHSIRLTACLLAKPCAKARNTVAPNAQGEKLGAALLQDAVNRAVGVACHAEAGAVLVYALHERAKQFYEHDGFQASAVDAMTLMLRVKP